MNVAGRLPMANSERRCAVRALKVVSCEKCERHAIPSLGGRSTEADEQDLVLEFESEQTDQSVGDGPLERQMTVTDTITTFEVRIARWPHRVD
jgi:hypothetical protein